MLMAARLRISKCPIRSLYSRVRRESIIMKTIEVSRFGYSGNGPV